ncbi:MAG: chemotaxis protein CheX [Desulforhopalus sp.]
MEDTVEISGKIIESTHEIFSSMVMMEVSVNGDITDSMAPLTSSITGVIGLAGTHKGVLAIHFPKSVAMAITGGFLGMDVEEMNEDVEDAVGELANMLGGNVKAILSDNGRDIELSLPSVISGESYDFQPTRDVDRVVIPFLCDAGEFIVELELEK